MPMPRTQAAAQPAMTPHAINCVQSALERMGLDAGAAVARARSRSESRVGRKRARSAAASAGASAAMDVDGQPPVKRVHSSKSRCAAIAMQACHALCGQNELLLCWMRRVVYARQARLPVPVSLSLCCEHALLGFGCVLGLPVCSLPSHSCKCVRKKAVT